MELTQLESQEKKFLKKIFKKFLIFFLWVLFFLGIGFVIYQTYFVAGKIEILTETPPSILAGQEFKITTKIVNYTPFPLKNASLKLLLPENASSSDFEKKDFLYKPLGDIPKKTKIKEEFSLRLFAKPSQIQKLKLILSWEKPGFKIHFKKEKEIEIAISEPIVSLDFFTPKEILPENEFLISLKYQNNSSKILENLTIKFLFPEDFQLITSSAPLSENLLLIKKLSPFEIKKIDLKAKISSSLESKKTLPISAEISFLRKNQKFLIERKEAKITLIPPPLSLKIVPSIEPEKPLNLGEGLHFKIFYQNHTQIALKDLLLKVKLDSKLFDIETLNTDGEFNSKTKEITWFGAIKDSLKSLSPNQQDFVEFKISLKKEFLPKTQNDFNQTIKIKAEITSPTVPYYLQAEKLISKTEISFKLQTKIDFACKIFFYDAPSKILNQGPFPPKVNQTTNFTIHWEIKNYFNDLENLEIKTFLPENVTYTEIFKTNTNSSPIYNERTKELVWKVEKIEKGAGIIKEKSYLIFQIALTPSILQKNKFAILEDKVILSGIDSFTQTEIYSACDPISTGDLWKYDPQIPPGKGLIEE